MSASAAGPAAGAHAWTSSPGRRLRARRAALAGSRLRSRDIKKIKRKQKREARTRVLDGVEDERRAQREPGAELVVQAQVATVQVRQAARRRRALQRHVARGPASARLVAVEEAHGRAAGARTFCSQLVRAASPLTTTQCGARACHCSRAPAAAIHELVHAASPLTTTECARACQSSRAPAAARGGEPCAKGRQGAGFRAGADPREPAAARTRCSTYASSGCSRCSRRASQRQAVRKASHIARVLPSSTASWPGAASMRWSGCTSSLYLPRRSRFPPQRTFRVSDSAQRC